MGESSADLLSSDALTKAIGAAEHAFSAAGDLDALARAKTDHLGDRSAVAQSPPGAGDPAQRTSEPMPESR